MEKAPWIVAQHSLGILPELARAKIESWYGPIFPDSQFSMLTAPDRELQHLLSGPAPNLHPLWTSPHLVYHFAVLSLQEKNVITITREC